MNTIEKAEIAAHVLDQYYCATPKDQTKLIMDAHRFSQHTTVGRDKDVIPKEWLARQLLDELNMPDA
jgi:hypothetical protein